MFRASTAIAVAQVPAPGRRRAARLNMISAIAAA
jgi:hypothetical protein